jgi:hypothetical protein
MLREHGQVFVSEADATGVDTLLNILADLMRVSSVNHVQLGPSCSKD